MIPVEPNWWKNLFDDIYLITDARSVCNQELTQREVDFLELYLELDKEHRILDLCGGQGRHSLELARRGYRFITVLDYSDYLVSFGRKRADREGLSVRFMRSDARETGLSDGCFDFVLVMANSFGYFTDDRDNLRLLSEAHRLCRPGGKLLLDMLDRNHVIRRFRSFSCHRASDEVAVIRERERDEKHIFVRESVMSRARGMIREGTYCARLYREQDLVGILEKSGFTCIKLKNNFSSHTHPGDYGFLNSRVIVTAQRA